MLNLKSFPESIFLSLIFALGMEFIILYESKYISSVTQLRPTLCDPVNRSTPGLPVHHQLPESTQTPAH